MLKSKSGRPVFRAPFLFEPMNQFAGATLPL
jgi:hypothetical protein